MKAQRRTKAVGYVRVSTERQACEGVSLDAQRHKLGDYCRAMDIELVDIVADEGYSASTLKRPGLQAALAMLRKGKAESLIVVKLDRLTRCVKDLGALCEQYFSEGKPYTLLSLSDAIDTRSASGKLVLNVLTSVAQWEREAIADRTRTSMAELKRQGVWLGGAPYGWRYSDTPDANGRRVLVEEEREQQAIRRLCELYDADVPVLRICEQLSEEGLPPRGPRWYKRSLYRILERAGYADPCSRKSTPRPKREPVETRRDKRAAATRAEELRRQGLSLRQIGARLLGEGYFPARGAQWYAATVLELLRPAVTAAQPPCYG